MNTHFFPYDTGHQALCGEFVDRVLHSSDPSCVDCRVARSAERLSLSELHAQELAETEPPEPGAWRVVAATGERGGVIGRPRPGADNPVSEQRRPSDPLPRAAVAAGDIVTHPSVPNGADSGRQDPLPEPPEPSGGLTVVQDTETVVAEARALTVIDSAATLARGEFLYTLLCDFEKAIHEEHDEACELAHAAWKHATSKRAERLKPILEAKPLLGERVAARRQFLKDEEARLKREDEERARRLQQEEAARAAAALKEEAERVRRAAEAEAAATKGTVRAAVIVEAAQKQAAELVAQAAEVVTEAKYAPLPALPARPSAVSRGAGVGDSKRWIAEFTDWKQMRADIGTGKYPEWDEAIQEVVLAKLNKLAPGLNVSLATKYPGAEARQKPGLAKR